MAVRLVATELVGTLRMRCQPSMMLALRPYATTPSELKYASSHEWVRVEGDVGTIGITDHAQLELGDVVYVEMPDVGQQVEQGQTFGVVESVKAASDVNSPISGEVLEKNDALSETPALVNKGPFEDGWMIKVKLSDKKELGNLLDAAAYEKHCEDSAH